MRDPKITKIKTISLKEASRMIPYMKDTTPDLIFLILLSLNMTSWKWRPIRTWLSKVHYFKVTVTRLDLRKFSTKTDSWGCITRLENTLEEMYDCKIFGSQIGSLDLDAATFNVEMYMRFHNEAEIAMFILQYG